MIPESPRARASFWATLCAASALWLLCAYALLPGCAATLPQTNALVVAQMPSVIMLKPAAGGGGTGFVIRSERDPDNPEFFKTMVATAGHVIEGEVSLAGSVLGLDLGQSVRKYRSDTLDLAILEFTTSQQFPAVSMSRTEPARRGEHVWLIGYPWLLQTQVTQGTIGDARPVELLPDWKAIVPLYLWADPGNSGSAVFDDNGAVLGVLVMGWPRARGASGFVPLAGEAAAWIDHILSLPAPYWDLHPVQEPTEPPAGG